MMKKTLYAFLLFISVFMIKAQESPRPDFKNMSQQERREYIKSLSPEQRRKLMEDAAAMMAIRNLQIPVEKQDAFKKLLSEYSQSQRAIKEKFKPNKARNQELSDAEAKQMIENGERSAEIIKNRIVELINTNVPDAKIDYIEIVDYESVTPAETIKGECLIAEAVYIDGVRLIDNVIIKL